jgi:hypothetical protein
LFNDLIQRTVCLREKRLTAREVLNHPFFSDVHILGSEDNPCKGIRYTTAIQPKSFVGENLEDIILNLKDDKKLSLEEYYVELDFLLKIFKKYRFQLRTIFLTLHNIHRSVDVLINYDVNELRLLMVVNLYLASSELESSQFLVDDFLRLFLIDTTKDKFFNMTRDILNYLRGVVYTYTYWDLCENPDDLVELFEDTINWNYFMNLKGKNLAIESVVYHKGKNHSSIKKLVPCDSFVTIWEKLRSYTNSKNLFDLIIKENKDPKLRKKIVIKIVSPDSVTQDENEIQHQSINPLPSQTILKTFYDILSRNIDFLFLLGFVYALRFEMKTNIKLSNLILDKIINSVSNPHIFIFDIVYETEKKGSGKEKLQIVFNAKNKIRNLDIKNLTVNVINVSNEELIAILDDLKKKQPKNTIQQINPPITNESLLEPKSALKSHSGYQLMTSNRILQPHSGYQLMTSNRILQSPSGYQEAPVKPSLSSIASVSSLNSPELYTNTSKLSAKKQPLPLPDGLS